MRALIERLKMTRRLFKQRHEPHWKYMLRLYWYDYKDFTFGVLSGLVIVVLFYFSI